MLAQAQQCGMPHAMAQLKPRRAAPVVACAAFSSRQHMRKMSSRAAASSRTVRSVVASAAQTAPGAGTLISRVEIPAFIPRSDIADQLIRWAFIEIQESGVANVGCPCKVVPYEFQGETWGFTVSFLKDGVSAADIRVAFDEEVTTKHEWVGRGADGFPVLEGESQDVRGKNFEIRKVNEEPVSEPIRASIKQFCPMLVGAINKYYAFGSCFVDDAT